MVGWLAGEKENKAKLDLKLGLSLAKRGLTFLHLTCLNNFVLNERKKGQTFKSKISYLKINYLLNIVLFLGKLPQNVLKLNTIVSRLVQLC